MQTRHFFISELFIYLLINLFIYFVTWNCLLHFLQILIPASQEWSCMVQYIKVNFDVLIYFVTNLVTEITQHLIYFLFFTVSVSEFDWQYVDAK